MFRFSRPTAVTRQGTTITCRPGSVRIESAAVFGQQSLRWQSFIECLAGLAEVDSLEIDRKTGIAEVRYEPKRVRGGTPAFLQRMAAALAGGGVGAATVTHPTDHLAERPKIHLVRRGGEWTTCQPLHQVPGRMRLRDRGLKGRAGIARQVENELMTLPGVRAIAVNQRTGSIVVRYDAAHLAPDELREALDESLRAVELSAIRTPHPPKAGYTLANAALALATVGEFMFPAVLPASALLLVGSNLPTFRGAAQDIRLKRCGLPLLHTSIVLATLATGGFLASSLMSWMLLFWHNRHSRKLASARQLLGTAVRQQQRTAWVYRDGVELETPVARLQIGDTLSLRAGDLVPVDGELLSGSITIDEGLIGGGRGWACRAPGDAVRRSSHVLAGEAQLKVLRCGDQTIAEAIGRSLDAAAADMPLDFKKAPPKVAERAVPPVLLTAGLGLMVGDPVTAGAILRPDYATGPGLGGSLLLIHQLAESLQTGTIARRRDVFDRIARVDLVLLDDGSALRQRDIELYEIFASHQLSSEELLQCAECALRNYDDPRLRALTAAAAARGLAALSLPVENHGANVSVRYRGRRVEINGLNALRPSERSQHALQYGLLVADAVCGAAPANYSDGSNESLSGSLYLTLDEHPAGELRFREGSVYSATTTIEQLRTDCRLQVGLLSDASPEERDRLASDLRADFQEQAPSDAAKAEYIARLQKEGHRVMFVGDTVRNPLAASTADVTVNPAPDLHMAADPADAWLLAPGYERIVRLAQLSRHSRSQDRLHHGLTMLPNLACVAGAFLFGFTSLASVLLSNFGTYTVYNRSMATLRRTEHRLLQRRSRTRRSPRAITGPTEVASRTTGLPE